jgi:transposase-like protein
MAQRDAEILRRELDRVGGRRRPCFSADLKQRATAWIIKRRAEGVGVSEIASELGLAPGTVLKWSARSNSSRALVPVEVVADQSAARTVSILSPSGFRVEGLSLLEAAALLRALA